MTDFFQRYRTVLIISGLVIGVAAIGVIVFFVFFRPLLDTTDTNTNGNANGNSTVNRLPNSNSNRPLSNQNGNANTNSDTSLPEIAEVANGGPTKVTNITTDDAAMGSLVEATNGYVYYDKETNKFYIVQPNGEKRELSAKEFFQVQSVVWSEDGTKAIMSFPDGSKIFHDFSSDRSATLPKEITEVSFTETGDKIAYEYEGDSDQDRWLAVSNPDGSNQQIIEPIGDRGERVSVNWSPDGQVVATYREGVGVNREEVYFVGQNGENFKSLVVDGSGFTGRWSDDGSRMLYSVYNSSTGYRPNLYIVDAKGDAIGLNKEDLNLQTWPDKCAFSGSSLYCAVPTSLPEGAGLAPESTQFVTDYFYRVDLTTGQKSRIAVPTSADGSQQYNAEKLYLSKDGKSMYFRNGFTGRLATIALE